MLASQSIQPLLQVNEYANLHDIRYMRGGIFLNQ